MFYLQKTVFNEKGKKILPLSSTTKGKVFYYINFMNRGNYVMIKEILLMQDLKKKKDALQKHLVEFVEQYVDITKKPIVVSMAEMMLFDPDLPQQFCETDSHNLINSALYDIIQIKFSHDDVKHKPKINYISYDQMPFKQIKDFSIDDQYRIVRLQGFVEGISGIFVDVTTKYKCDACGHRDTEKQIMKKCGRCNTVLEDSNRAQSNKMFRDFELKESYDYKQVSESIHCYIELAENPENNIFDIESMLNKKLDFLAQLIITKSRFKGYQVTLRIIGVKDAKTRQLTDERKKEIDEFVADNKDNLIDMLIEHIWHGHHGNYYEKKMMLLVAMGLNKEDSNFHPHTTKQMMMVWVGYVGIGKSTLMERLMEYMANTGSASQASSAGGIRGAVDKNERGQFIFRSGEITRCNNGCLFVDELGFVDDETKNTISEVMSSEKISYKKIIKVEHKIFLNFVLCGNPPKGGEFDPYSTRLENAGVSPQIRDRATVIIITDQPEKNERKMSKIFSSSIGFVSDEKKFKLDDDFVRDVVLRIKDYPNPHIDKQMDGLAQKHYMKIATLDPEQFGQDVKRVQTFNVRGYQSYVKTIKTIGRFKNNANTTENDITEAWDTLFISSYQKLLQDYGTIDLTKFEIQEKHKLLEEKKVQKEVPKNKEELKKYILKRIKESKQIRFDVLLEEINAMNIPELEFDNALNELIRKFQVTDERGTLKEAL